MLDLISRHSLRKSKNVISVLGGSVNIFDVLIGFEGQRHKKFLSWGSMGACSINNCTKDCHPSQMRETMRSSAICGEACNVLRSGTQVWVLFQRQETGPE